MRQKTPEYRLKKIIKLCQGAGIKRVQIEGVEIEFYPAAEPAGNVTDIPPSNSEPTPEELRFWSTPQDDEPSEET